MQAQSIVPNLALMNDPLTMLSTLEEVCLSFCRVTNESQKHLPEGTVANS